jgi:CRP-like cAMP-binding protein
MISPELVRRYSFFGMLDETQTRAVAMICDEVPYEKDVELFKEGDSARFIYFLISGNVDLYFTTREESRPDMVREYYVGTIDPEEIFGISALIEPFKLTATARTNQPSRIIQIDGQALRSLFEMDCSLGFKFMRQVARVAVERLNATRVQLAACWQ